MPHFTHTLFSRLMLIWLIGISAVLTVSLALFFGERGRHNRLVIYEGIAQETAALVDVLNHMTQLERSQWVDNIGRQRLQFNLVPPFPIDNISPLPEHYELVKVLKKALPEYPLLVARHWHQGQDTWPQKRLFALITLGDGNQVAIRLPPLRFHARESTFSPQRFYTALFALVAGISLLAWLAVRVTTRPLSRLADAARALGEDPDRPPLPVCGPTEVAQATSAFNQMQRRIQEHMRERTRILAAISHDLQTPVTRLHLRAEQIDDEPLRKRIQSDLDTMQTLIREGLEYARSLGTSTPLQHIDLNSLVQALSEDAHAMGWKISCHGQFAKPCLGHALSLRRALWNLIENAVKFGETAVLELQTEDSWLILRIRDHGPGINEAELETVFEPFYRTEFSRNRKTGGTGLGLAIARNLLRAQGGELILSNAPQGGLEAMVRLRSV